MKYVVSACLAGVACRYDGGGAPHPLVMALARANATPAPFWLSLPLVSLARWIASSNQLTEDAIRERNRLRKI